MEEVQEKGIEFESDCSDDSEIPEEHENGLSYNEYFRRYRLNMKFMTWSRDSQGLFDYETRQCVKAKAMTDKPARCIRVNQDCKVVDADYDIEKKEGKQGQLLFNIRKIRNHYMIEPSEIEKLKTLTPAQRKEFMAKDVDM